MEANVATPIQADGTSQSDSSAFASAGANEATLAAVEEAFSRTPQDEAIESTSEAHKCNLCFLCFDTQEGGYCVEKVEFQWPERIVVKDRLYWEERVEGSKIGDWRTITENQGSTREVFEDIRAVIRKPKAHETCNIRSLDRFTKYRGLYVRMRWNLPRMIRGIWAGFLWCLSAFTITWIGVLVWGGHGNWSTAFTFGSLLVAVLALPLPLIILYTT